MRTGTTVKELIETLQKFDQDLIVSDGCAPLWFVEQMPVWYDGRLQLMHVPEGDSWPRSASFAKTGNKLVLKFYGIESALIDDPDMPIDIDGLSDHYIEMVERWRNDALGE
jgi:hypothetical protein